MRIKTLLVITVLFFSISILIPSCVRKKAEWRGAVEEENGVRVVKNPEEPYYGELVLDLEEDLSIGRENDENYQFYRVNDLEIDSRGNIYVADGGNCRIQKFDHCGNYILTIGRKGQGPGEFTRIYDILIDDQDILYVLGRRRIQTFSSSGEYLDGFPLENSIYDFFLDSDGLIFAVYSVHDEEGRKAKVVKLNSEGKLIKEYAEFSDQKSVQRKSGETVVTFTATHAYTPELLLTAKNRQTFCYAHTLRHEIFVIDKNGEQTLKTQTDTPSHSITQGEKDYIIKQLEKSISRRGQKWPKGVLEEACDFPSSRPFFWGMVADDVRDVFV